MTGLMGGFDIDNAFTWGAAVGHVSYMLLVLSMMMRTMTKLRIIAVSAGLTSMAYGFFWLNDPVTVFWETVFVSVNLVQLLIITYENRHATFSDEQKVVIESMVPGSDRRNARRILSLGSWHEADPGTVLIEEDQMTTHLILLVRGAVQVERNSKIIGVCGEGDFLGEISYLNDVAATATAVVANHVRYFSFERERLSEFLKRDPELRQRVEASFNRNLVGKLVKTSHAVMAKQSDFEVDVAKEPQQAGD